MRLLNPVTLAISILAAVLILVNPTTAELIQSSGEYGYIGAFVVGVFYTSGLTAPIALATLYLMGKTLDPFLLSVIAALGALVSDTLMLQAMIGGVQIDDKFLKRHPLISKYVRVFGFLLFALPLPDEVPISLLGITRTDVKKVVPFIYLAKFVGIFTIATASRII